MLGPAAWDWVARVPSLPAVGEFVQAASLAGRPGGSGANLARALATTGVPTQLVSYVGSDPVGEALVRGLCQNGVRLDHLQRFDWPTSQVALLVEASGERTMVGLAEDRLAEVPVPVDDMADGDLCVCVGWHASFREPLQRLASRGIPLACVPFDPQEHPVSARWVVGSRLQLPASARSDPWRYYCDRSEGLLEAVVITNGAGPVQAYTAAGYLRVDVPQVPVVDTTGAGDSFAAGLVSRLAGGHSLEEALRTANCWAAATVQSDSSVPVPWSPEW